jgi:hypothetical protein
MTIIAEKDRSTVRDLLARELVEDVELLLFTRGRSRLFVPGRQECQTCDETRELLEELVALSDRLHVTSHDVGEDPVAATLYNVEEVPTVIVRRRPPATEMPEAVPADERIEATSSDRESVPAAIQVGTSQAEIGANVRFLGLPGGYEFSTLLADIVDVSKGRTDLSAEVLDVVRSVDRPVHIQVFVTPT